MRYQCTVIGTILALAGAAQGQVTFQGLGDLPGGKVSSRARAVSADGRVVAGSSQSEFGGEAFIWTEAGGMIPLGDLPGGPVESEVFALNADGSAGAGQGHIGVDMAFQWTEAEGIIGLAELDGGGFGGAGAFAITADGSLLAGSDAGPNGREAILLRPDFGAAIGLGDLPGGEAWSEARGMSADGAVIVGSAKSGSGIEAFIWTDDEGMVGLGDFEGGSFSSRGEGVSGDGRVVVGWGTTGFGTEAFSWTAAGGLIGLGHIEGGGLVSHALAASHDGSTIVGDAFDADGGAAFIWTQAAGMRSLKQVLVEQGADLDGWTLRSAESVSADGRVIVGTGTNPAGDFEGWIAHLGAACYPDFSGDGGLDLFDFLSYVNAFNAGEERADCTGDGALDLFDFLCFVNAFNAGC